MCRKFVPAEVFDPGPLQRRHPGFGACLEGDRFASEREHPHRVLTELLVKDSTGNLVQGYRMRLAVLVLAAGNPSVLPFKVHIFPLQSLDVALAKTGDDREHRHVGEVGRKLPSQGIELLWGQGADSTLGFTKQLEPRHSIDPLPLAAGAAKNCPNERQVAVRTIGRNRLFQLASPLQR